MILFVEDSTCIYMVRFDLNACTDHMFWFVWFLLYCPSTHFRSFRVRSVTLTTLFLGKPPRQLTSNWQLLFMTQQKRENGPRNFFHDQVSTKECARRGDWTRGCLHAKQTRLRSSYRDWSYESKLTSTIQNLNKCRQPYLLEHHSIVQISFSKHWFFFFWFVSYHISLHHELLINETHQ